MGPVSEDHGFWLTALLGVDEVLLVQAEVP